MSDERALSRESPVEAEVQVDGRTGLPGPLRVGQTLAGPLLFLPRIALGAAMDIRAIARSTAELPEVRRQLVAIEEHIESLDHEVLKMRQGVDSIGTEVVELREDVGPLTRAVKRVGMLRRRRPPGPSS
jgi:hypothetical protein